MQFMLFFWVFTGKFTIKKMPSRVIKLEKKAFFLQNLSKINKELLF